MRRLVLLWCISQTVVWAGKTVVTQKAEVIQAPRSSTSPTRLLFAFVTTQAGFDTEITISNTSLDTSASNPQSGTCTLNFYGSGTATGTTTTIFGGHQLVFNLSQGGGGIAAAPNFQGYLIATCNFSLARGTAKIYTAGAPGYSQDATQITLPRSTALPQYLLFPFVTNQAGFDTGILIANTAKDPYGTSPVGGTCTFQFYGANAPSPFSTGIIAAGTVYGNLASVMAPNFQGYVIASCNFQGTAGSSYVTDVGAHNVMLAESPEVVVPPRDSVSRPLLFSSVSNRNGLDTGIAIANTGADPFGSSFGSTGCTLNFMGVSAPSPMLTPTINVGTVFTVTLSQIAPNFQGYITATCGFPLVRGWSYTGPVGLTGEGDTEIPELLITPRNGGPAPLLFTTVSSGNGSDTSIVISNTSQDPYGTTPTPGSCTLSYFGSMLGGGSVPSPQVSSSIPAGSQLTFTISGGNAAQGIAATPGFRGYLIADCGFPVARGMATITVQPPVLSIIKSHTGNFAQGQTGATYTVTVSNSATAGPTSTNTVTVTDTPTSGISLVSLSGNGWSCGTSTCTRNDPLAPGSSYPPITVTVNVASNANSPQINSVSVAGGGSATANTTDSTTITALPPVLSIVKSHSGNFAQGQLGATYSVVVSNAAGAGPTTASTVTVTDTPPSGISLVSLSGSGWACGTTTCTRNDSLAPGSSYPTITVTVNVAANASTPQINSVSVSGGGSAPANTTDSTTISTCSYSLSPIPPIAAVSYGPSTGNVAVNVGPGCPWSAGSDSPWLNITSGASGAGSGTVGYSVDVNPVLAQRSGTLTIAGIAFPVTQLAPPQRYVPQGLKLVGSGATGLGGQGSGVSLSANGNTAIVGGANDSSNTGAAWIYNRQSGTWTQTGSKLVGIGGVGGALQGASVAMSGDGNTAMAGGPTDNNNAGAAWVYTRSGSVWSQQGSKLVGTGSVGSGAQQGNTVVLSADGNTAAVGGPLDNSSAGAVWIFTRSSGVWSQQGSKLVGTGNVGAAEQGVGLSMSSDGNTLLVGGNLDNGGVGAAWVFTRSGGVWTQQGSKLVGTGAVGGANQGSMVALSSDGNTAIVGGYLDNGGVGASWIFTRSGGVWTQQGGKLVGTGNVGASQQGFFTAMSGDGNTAAVGGNADNGNIGATWVFFRSAGGWTQLGAKLVGGGSVGSVVQQGYGVAMSSDASTILVGGPSDNTNVGAVWPFVISGATPSIAGFSPVAATAGGPSFTLTVNAGNIFAGAVVNWNGIALGTIFASATQLQASVPSGLFGAAGNVSITVSNPDGSTSAPVSYGISPAVSITGPASLPAGTPGVAYTSTQIAVSGGLGPYTYTAPALPSGLSISPSGGLITGTPSGSGGVFSVDVTARDSNQATATRNYSLTISSGVSISCQSVNFTYTIGGSIPANQPCNLSTQSSGTPFTVATSTQSGGGWLGATPTSGLTPNTVSVGVNILGLPAGSYSGSVNFTISGQLYSVPASLTINPSSQVIFTLTPSSTTAPAGGGPATAALSLNPSSSNASWSVARNVTWLHITSPASGNGSGGATIGYTADANTGAARTGLITVSSGGSTVATLTVNQLAASCSSLSVSPASFIFGSGGGSGTLTFNNSPCPWTASTNDSSLVVLSQTSGSSATLSFSVPAGLVAKNATITIPSTAPPTTITVARLAPVCTYTVTTPGAIGSSQSFLAGANGGSINVTAPGGCGWTAVSNNPSFLTVNSFSGGGSGGVSYSISSNPSFTASRTGTITVAGSTYTITQAPQGLQNYNCAVSAGAPPVMRSEGLAEFAGDIVLSCSGFSSGLVTGDVLVTLNTSLTNHTVDANGQTSDALILMDEPTSAQLALTGAHPNAFRGTIAGPQALRFKNVTLAPESGNFSHTFRITNARVDANHLGSGQHVTALVSIVSAAPFAISGGSQTVGFIQAGSSFAVGSSSTSPLGKQQPITFAESFAAAYKVRLLTSGQDPSQPGTTYASESGFVNTVVLGSDTGFATNATRLVARFSNIPQGTNVYAPVSQTSGGATALLVSADSNGAGGSPMQGGAQVPGYQPVLLVNGAGTATWEITAANPNAIDTLTFNLLFDSTSLSLISTCTSGAAPAVCGSLGPQVGVSGPSSTAPAPRFFNPAVIAPLLVTRLNVAPNPGVVQFSAPTPAGSSATVHAASRVAPRASQQTGGTLPFGILIASDPNSPNATNACVGTTLPSSYTFTNCTADNGGQCGPTGTNQMSVCYPNFPPGSSSNIGLLADTPDPSGNAVEADSNATSDQGNFGDGAFSQILTPAPAGSVTLGLSGPTTSAAGQVLTYNFSVTNTSTFQKIQGDPVAVTITPDPQLTAVSYSLRTDPLWNCNTLISGIICTTFTAIAPGGSIAFTATGTVPAGASTLSTSATISLAGQVSASVPPTFTTTLASTIQIAAVPSNAGLKISVDNGTAVAAPQNLNLTPGSHTIAAPSPQAGPSGTQYVFVSWSDNGAISHTIQVGGSASYTATFKSQSQLTISASTGGTVSPASGFYDTGTAVTIVATANAGFVFSGWAGNVVGPSSATTTVNMTAAQTVVANFTPINTGSNGQRFVTVTPCRIIDTRSANGPFGGPAIPTGGTRDVAIPQSPCGIPSTAQAYSLNITVVPHGTLGYLTVWPAGQSQPGVSTLNSLDGRIVANAAIVPAGANGSITMFASDTTDVIVDINGYFAPSTTTGSLAFYTATPCRVVDTRFPNGPFAGPLLGANSTRSFVVPSSSCGIPTTAQAYSLNITVIPRVRLGFLTLWPAGQPQPLVSTLNAPDSSAVANAAIVKAGTGGAINLFATDDTDLIIDINGYFAPDGSSGALSLYTLAPCRVADTRLTPGPFGGPALGTTSSRNFAMPASSCGIPSSARAYSLNLTVVPPGPLIYLTAWPAGQLQPTVSTLNSFLGKIVANAAIVPAGSDGSVSIFVSDTSHVILDINAYFAQ